MYDIAGHGNGSDWNAFCSNPDLLQILVRVTFMTKHIQVTRARSSSAGCSNLSDEGSCDNARVVMFGKCRVHETLPPTYK